MIATKKNPAIGWWSGGVVSACVCKIIIDWFGVDNVRIIFIDTKNEDDDTYRFLKECELWYKCKIETITSNEYDNIEDVWFDSLSLNMANGAKCTEVLKIKVRQQFCKKNTYSYHAFGFDSSEIQRAKDMNRSYPILNPIYPALGMAMSKKDCIKMVQNANSLFLSIKLPRAYTEGYSNNNCFKTGCVKGGIGYWQKIQRDYPEKFKKMADREHEITNLKGQPVTICKDQSKGGGLVFLLPHPKYPNFKDLSMMSGRQPENLVECDAFCKRG